MRKTPDLKNKRFGRLVVLDLSDGYVDEKYKRRGWVCECDCGNVVLLRGDVIQRENTYGCGCGAGSHLKTHGLSKHPLHSIWKGMKARCYNNKCEAYKNYGGRGIKVCDRWLTFDNFLNDMGERPNLLTIERINNNGNYELSNCRWATRKEQCNNRRSNQNVEFNGMVKNFTEWEKFLNLKPGTIARRLKNKWSVEEALTTLIRPTKEI